MDIDDTIPSQVIKHSCITVVGNPGTGKSTFVQWLTLQLNAEQIAADTLFQANPFFPLAVEDRKRWSFTSDIWFLQKRVELYKNLPELLKESPVIIDSGLPMSFVYAHSRLESGFFTHDEWDLYKNIYLEMTQNLHQPDLIIYLQLPVEKQRERIVARGREFEVKHHSIEYLTSLQHSLEYMVEQEREMGAEIFPVTEQDVFNNVLLNKIEIILAKIRD